MPTHADVAEHLDLRERAVRELRDRGVIPDPAEATLAEVRVAYLRHLRGQAEARTTTRGDGSLVDARARLARSQAERVERQNAADVAELGTREEFETTWSAELERLRARLRELPEAMRARIPGFRPRMAREARSGVEAALRHLEGDPLPPRRRRARRRR